MLGLQLVLVPLLRQFTISIKQDKQTQYSMKFPSTRWIYDVL